MKNGPQVWSRRAFLKQAGLMGALLGLNTGRIFPLRRVLAAIQPGATAFQYRSVSTRHLPELASWMTRLDEDGRLSANGNWRQYVGSFQYAPPKQLTDARSLIVMSVPLPIAAITFHAAGRTERVMIPPGYADDGNTLDDFRAMLYRDGIVPPGSRLERARLPLKQLAVRAGLAAYGRNNIAYVDGYGSYHQLLAFYSGETLADHWRPLRMLRECKGCSLCLHQCPTDAIRASDFVIDPQRCLTLYNELPAPIPAWIPASAHNALVGCLKCQVDCPGNEERLGETWDLGDVTEAETLALLQGEADPVLERTLKDKLRGIGGGGDLPYMARNLKLVLDASAAHKAT